MELAGGFSFLIPTSPHNVREAEHVIGCSKKNLFTHSLTFSLTLSFPLFPTLVSLSSLLDPRCIRRHDGSTRRPEPVTMMMMMMTMISDHDEII